MTFKFASECGDCEAAELTAEAMSARNEPADWCFEMSGIDIEIQEVEVGETRTGR